MDKEPDQDSAGSRHKECTVCGEVLETEELEKLYASSTTDEHGEAVVGRYLVIVTDTDSKAPVSGAAVELGGEGTCPSACRTAACWTTPTRPPSPSCWRSRSPP